MRVARVLPNDESCAFASDTRIRDRVRFDDARPRSALRPILQPAISTQWNPLGRALPLLHRRIRVLRARLLSLHRTQSGGRWHGAASVGLLTVQLRGKQRYAR